MSFGCEKCSKTFVQKSAMTRHIKRCSNQTIYQCTVEGCRKIFSQSSQLRAHENVHTKKKPYVCGIGDCPAKFGDPSSKARHVKEIHRTTHVNVCPVAGCNTRIKRNSAYNAHLKRKHGITNVKANLQLRLPVLEPPTDLPTSSNNTIESMSSAYTNDQRDSAPPLVWPSSIPQTFTPLPVEPNNISIYSRTRLSGEIPEVPLVVDPEFHHWSSDAYGRVFRVDDYYPPLNVEPFHDTTPLCSNYGFHDDFFSNYDIYNPHRRSTMGSSTSSHHWDYGAYHMFSDTGSESGPPSVFSSDLASLGHCSPTLPVLSLPC